MPALPVKTMSKHRLQYLLLVFAGALLRILPRRAALGVAYLFHIIALPLGASRIREARRRIRLVCGDSLTDAQVRRIARISLRNTFFNVVEMLSVAKFTLPRLRRICDGLDAVLDKPRALSAASGGRGIVITLPHCGNWDLAGSMCCLSGLPIFSVAGKQRNPYVNDLINRSREGHGMTILERGGGAIRQILTRLSAGEMFAILPDTRSPTPELKVPFLGGEANIARGMAEFAWQAKVPILPVVIRRVGWTRFSVKTFDEITPDFTAPKDAELLRLTAETMAIFDREIRSTPEQWFWYNKRWVLEPVAGQR